MLWTSLFITGSLGDWLTLAYVGVSEANQSAARSAAGANGMLSTNAHEVASEAQLKLPVGSKRETIGRQPFCDSGRAVVVDLFANGSLHGRFRPFSVVNSVATSLVDLIIVNLDVGLESTRRRR